MVGQNPQHTYRKDGIYYYCRRVPKDLLIRYDEERIVMSLRTKSITAARRSAAAITSRLDGRFVAKACQGYGPDDRGSYLLRNRLFQSQKCSLIKVILMSF